MLVYTTALIPQDVERRLAGWAEGHGRTHRVHRQGRRRARVGGLRRADRGRASCATARGGCSARSLWWAFDIATLWAAFHAFSGDPPEIAVIVVAYFVGMLGNMLPLPGGIGGVDGGMIGAFAAFGVDFGLRHRRRPRPTARSRSGCRRCPGAIAYLQLRKTVAGWREEHRRDGTHSYT